MSYTICYGQEKSTGKRRLFILSAFFFLFFVLLANLIFPAELMELRDIVISKPVQDAVAAFCQDLLEGTQAYGD